LTWIEVRARSHETLSRGRSWGGFGGNPGPCIAALAVCERGAALSQRDVLDRLGLAGDEFAEGVFARCGVERRNLDISHEFVSQTLHGRSGEVEERLAGQAIATVRSLNPDPHRIGTVITSSLYSLGCPSLAHRLIDELDMCPSTDKYHVTSVGCASAVPLFRLAGGAIQQRPESDVLVVAAESMSSILTPATPHDHRAKTVGSAIFGDGCAAAVISRDERAHGPLILASAVHQLPGTLGAVSLTLTEKDSHLHLARELPDLAAADLGQLVDGFLHKQRTSTAAIDHWLIHPGGRRIVESARDALDLSDEDVELSWRALAEHGNIGTPSIFYVLKATISERKPCLGEVGLVVTIGPGVSVGLMLLQW